MYRVEINFTYLESKVLEGNLGYARLHEWELEA